MQQLPPNVSCIQSELWNHLSPPSLFSFASAGRLFLDPVTSSDKSQKTWHIVVSCCSWSSASRLLRLRVTSGWKGRGDGGAKDIEGWRDIYESDSSEGELHPNICSFIPITLRRKGVKLVQGFAGVSTVFGYVRVCANSGVSSTEERVKRSWSKKKNQKWTKILFLKQVFGNVARKETKL